MYLFPIIHHSHFGEVDKRVPIVDGRSRDLGDGVLVEILPQFVLLPSDNVGAVKHVLARSLGHTVLSLWGGGGGDTVS